MDIPISKARQRLPALVRLVREDSELRVRITVHGNVVAELRGYRPGPPPGAAARRLTELLTELPKAGRRKKRDISSRVTETLYGEKSE